MAGSKSLKTLAIVFFLSGIYDAFGGILYAFLFGTGRLYDDPPMHPFYAIFIASFLLCFAYLQILSAFNIKRYLFVIGAVIIGRVFYAVILFAYIFSANDFPGTFWFTGMLDLVWTTLYVMLAIASEEIHLKELFIPNRKINNDS